MQKLTHNFLGSRRNLLRLSCHILSRDYLALSTSKRRGDEDACSSWKEGGEEDSQPLLLLLLVSPLFLIYLAYGLVQHALFPTLPNVTEPLMLNTLNLRCNSKDAASSTFNQTVLKSRWVTCQTDLILDQVGFDKPVRCEKDLKGGGTIVSHCFTPRKGNKIPFFMFFLWT